MPRNSQKPAPSLVRPGADLRGQPGRAPKRSPLWPRIAHARRSPLLVAAHFSDRIIMQTMRDLALECFARPPSRLPHVAQSRDRVSADNHVLAAQIKRAGDDRQCARPETAPRLHLRALRHRLGARRRQQTPQSIQDRCSNHRFMEKRTKNDLIASIKSRGNQKGSAPRSASIL